MSRSTIFYNDGKFCLEAICLAPDLVDILHILLPLGVRFAPGQCVCVAGSSGVRSYHIFLNQYFQGHRFTLKQLQCLQHEHMCMGMALSFQHTHDPCAPPLLGKSVARSVACQRDKHIAQVIQDLFDLVIPYIRIVLFVQPEVSALKLN